MRTSTGGTAFAVAMSVLISSWNTTCLADSSEQEAGKPASPSSSPLDRLDRDQMTPIERTQLPAETVAVIPDGAGSILGCAFSPDGKLATACDNGTIGLWDLTGAVPKEITTVKLEDKTRVERVAFSADGKRMAAFQGETLQLWDIADGGAKPFVTRKLGRVQGLAFHPNNKLLAAGADNVGRFFGERKGDGDHFVD